MSTMQKFMWFLVVLGLSCLTTRAATEYDIVIRNGTIYDGSGGKAFNGDVAINGQTISAVGKLKDANPFASISRRAFASFSLPTAEIVWPLMATSPLKAFPPLPS